jgi:hypothetical protein
MKENPMKRHQNTILIWTFAVTLAVAGKTTFSAETETPHTHGALTISLPSDWKSIDREKSLYVQGRYVSGDEKVGLSIGTLVLPSLTLDEYIVGSTGFVRNGVKTSMKQLAEELGISEEQLTENLKAQAGSAVAEMMTNLKDRDLGITRVQKITCDSRRAYRVDSLVKLDEKEMYGTIISVEGFSPGEIINIQFAGTERLEDETINKIVRSAKIADQRVVINEFQGFTFKLPAGSAPADSPEITNENQRLKKFIYPLGPGDKGVLNVDQRFDQRFGSDEMDFPALVKSVRSRIEKQSKNPVFADISSVELKGLKTATIEFEVDTEIDGKPTRVGTRVLFVSNGNQLATFKFIFPPEGKASILRSADAIIATLQKRENSEASKK